jgi:hypothetical protein
MDIIEKTIMNITDKYYYDYKISYKENIVVEFIETKYSHIRMNQYYEMIEEIRWTLDTFQIEIITEGIKIV